MNKEKLHNSTTSHLEARGGVYDGIVASLFVEEDFREALIRRGDTELLNRNDMLLSKLQRLPEEIKSDLKNLSLNEIKEKYGLAGNKIDSEFLIEGLSSFVANDKK